MDSPIVEGMPAPSSAASPSIHVRIRRRIVQWMTMTETSQLVLAERIGKDQPWVSRYLAGQHDPDLPTLERMAAAFGHTLYALLDVPTDAQETRVIEMYRALKPSSRTLIVR